MRFWIVSLALMFWLAARPTSGDEPNPPPSLSIRLSHPDRELGRLIDLFRGSKVGDPAEAMAAWKRASPDPKRLGKPLEAVLAALNPRMAGELRSLEDARWVVRSWGDGGRPHWFATLPHDDGSFAALASAFVLTDGASEDPHDGVPVDRLGPPGSALMARGPGHLVIAGTRDDLIAGLKDPGPAGGDGGLALLAEVHPETMPLDAIPALTLPLRLLRAAGPRAVRVRSGLEGATLRAVVECEPGAGPVPGPAAIDPAWLDPVPRDRVVAAGAVALSPDRWEALFGLADRFEKQDPARADLAPARLRLGLLARAVGVRVDADLVPHLRGVSGWVGDTPGRGPSPDRGMVAAHFDDETVAARVLAAIRPDGRIQVARRGPSILIAWGEGLASSLEALERPDRSAGPILRAGWQGDPPARVGALWPGGLAPLLPADPPLGPALEASPPVVWLGRDSGSGSSDEIRWDGLDGTLRRFLDRIPLDPPPDR
ncbi:hypothetical protein TA3x_001220 [Tundrisphaera sp. TA3]|uniref:hypothetical protein n=1 Tax=Tundrisphaera sp. TA3 TaxID=3435775 RepID=UPI003EC131DD